MAGKEQKFERVEKVDVDSTGNATLKTVGVDRGGEDPALNFQDKRPAGLVPDPTVTGMMGHQGSATELHSSGTSGMGSSSTTRHSSSSHTSSGSAMGSHHHSSGMGSASSGLSGSMHSGGSSGMGGGATTYQRTEVTTTTGGPTIGGLQRTVTVPTGAHSTIREQTDVIKHHTSGGATQSETHVISVPVTSFESSNMESVRTGYTYTEDKALTVAAPQLAQPIHTTLDLQLGGGASAEIHAGTTVDLTQMQRKDLGPEEYARYKAKVEALAAKDERDAGKRAAMYREEVERDAELIRQILERQHIRDLEFRKEMIEHQVNRQEREIQLEAEYAMRALELERKAAREALEEAKAQTAVDVKFDTAIGVTISKGSISTSAEKHSSSHTGGATSTTTTTEQQRTTRI
ncbi:CAHS11 [Ramazzottius varieornatus]|uniref:CAHS11 n=1 Tax=Ramazzottius varieornatus TaxID=947166 RepID=A0A1D1VMX5_RAMVA|nr:CAHS11 [Ramazzottius varieornatus]